VRTEVLLAVNAQTAMFCDMMLCSNTTYTKLTEHHIPEKSNLHIHQIFHLSFPVLGCNIIVYFTEKQEEHFLVY